MTAKQSQAFEHLVEDYLSWMVDKEESSRIIWKYSEAQFIASIGNSDLDHAMISARDALSSIGAVMQRRLKKES